MSLTVSLNLCKPKKHHRKEHRHDWHRKEREHCGGKDWHESRCDDWDRDRSDCR